MEQSVFTTGSPCLLSRWQPWTPWLGDPAFQPLVTEQQVLGGCLLQPPISTPPGYLGDAGFQAALPEIEVICQQGVWGHPLLICFHRTFYWTCSFVNSFFPHRCLMKKDTDLEKPHQTTYKTYMGLPWYWAIFWHVRSTCNLLSVFISLPRKEECFKNVMFVIVL